MNSLVNESPPAETFRARVGKVRDDNIVVTYPIRQTGELTVTTNVTFHMNVWRGGNLPRPGQVVELEGVTLFVGGWRANSASPILPTRTN